MLVEIEARIARGRVGIEEAAAAPLDHGPTVSDLAARFLAEYESPRIRDLDAFRKLSRRCLARLLPFVGDVAVSRLTRRDLEKARDRLCKTRPANTVRAAFRPLSTMLTWAEREGIVVCAAMRGLQLPRQEQSVEYLTKEQVEVLLAQLEGAARYLDNVSKWSKYVAAELCLRAGLRRGEAFGLQWRDVDEAARRLTVRRSFGGVTKSGKQRHVPMSQELATVLQEWRRRCPITDDGVVCPLPFQGILKRSEKHSSQELRSAYAAAGIALPKRPWHILRHTFASHFVMSGGNLLALQRILGHGDVKMTTIYAHLAPDYLAAEVERVKFR